MNEPGGNLVIIEAIDIDPSYAPNKNKQKCIYFFKKKMLEIAFPARNIRILFYFVLGVTNDGRGFLLVGPKSHICLQIQYDSSPSYYSWKT